MQDMFQITLVAEIITVTQATDATLENTLTLPNLCNWHKIRYLFSVSPKNVPTLLKINVISILV